MRTFSRQEHCLCMYAFILTCIVAYRHKHTHTHACICHFFIAGKLMKFKNGEKNLRALVLSAVADAPARCLLIDMMQFNGSYGCPCCYSPGVTHQINDGTSSGRSHVYPCNTENDYGHDELRTHEETFNIAKEVELNYKTSRRADPIPIKGIKGISPLVFAPGFDIIRCTTIDYMHCILLGVVKMLLNLWFDVSHRNKKWSLRSHIKVLDKIMMAIQPPNFIHRMPKSFEEIGQWKASELRSFLVFFSIPVLCGYLPQEYFNHFILLSQASYIFLSQSISAKDLKTGQSMIHLFCANIENLYGTRYQTFNVHSLLHLHQKVKDLGPLWAHSCFFFEDLNGDLRSLFHGTSNVQDQVMMAVCVQQKVAQFQSLVSKNMEAEIFYKSLYHRKHCHIVKSSQISPGIHVVGCLDDQVNISADKHHILVNKFGNIQALKAFYRISINNRIIHSMMYSKVKKRNSYTIQFRGNNYGQIQCFLKCVAKSGCHYVALVNKLENIASRENTVQNILHMQQHRCTKQYEVIPVSYIENLCIFMKHPAENYVFTSTSPNFVERE